MVGIIMYIFVFDESGGSNEKHFDIYSYKRSAGIGYKFSDFILIPFTSRSTLNYNSENIKFDGRKREIGLHLNLFNFAGLSFSYNNTIFGENQSFLRKVATRGIERRSLIFRRA